MVGKTNRGWRELGDLDHGHMGAIYSLLDQWEPLLPLLKGCLDGRVRTQQIQCRAGKSADSLREDEDCDRCLLPGALNVELIMQVD